MSNLRRTPYPQISQRSASFSLASEALKPTEKSRTALDFAGTDLEIGRRLTGLLFPTTWILLHDAPKIVPSALANIGNLGYT
jgi:hypothetical protein